MCRLAKLVRMFQPNGTFDFRCIYFLCALIDHKMYIELRKSKCATGSGRSVARLTDHFDVTTVMPLLRTKKNLFEMSPLSLHAEANEMKIYFACIKIHSLIYELFIECCNYFSYRWNEDVLAEYKNLQGPENNWCNQPKIIFW